MAVFRVNKDKNYTTMSNYHFKDKRLSLKAKGLLSEMLSLPDDWDYSLAGLVAINKEEEYAIKSTLVELKECGYVKITKLLPNQTESSKIEYIYDIFEKGNQDPNFQPLEDQPLEVQPLENQTQLNTNNKSIKEVSTKEEKETILPQQSCGASAVDLFFEEMWKLYPRKKGKSEVKRAARVRLYKAGREVVVGAIERYKCEMEREHRSIEHIKYGSSFFNTSWQDYVADDDESEQLAIADNYVPKRRLTADEIDSTGVYY